VSGVIAWLAAEADRTGRNEIGDSGRGVPGQELREQAFPGQDYGSFSESQLPHFWQKRPEAGHPTEAESDQWWRTEDSEEQRQRRIYRGRTVAMLRKYMQYSIETGRMPSLLGREFFRSKVTSYTVVTFEDRVIFVHDMETSLGKLDEFSRELIARHILQEHDQAETGRLLQCTERTVRRLTPLIIDQLSEILLDVGLMEQVETIPENSCQGGKNGPFSVSDCEEGKNKF
jgi:DNA-directed RNA polymerase specialized sigma24 family protein